MNSNLRKQLTSEFLRQKVIKNSTAIYVLLYQNSDWTSAICALSFILLHFNFGFSGWKFV